MLFLVFIRLLEVKLSALSSRPLFLLLLVTFDHEPLFNLFFLFQSSCVKIVKYFLR